MSKSAKLFFVLIMGLMSILFGAKAKDPASLAGLAVDLASFKCGETVLGTPVQTGEPYAGHFDADGIAMFEASGIEFGTEDGVLHFGVFQMDRYPGTFLKNGTQISLSKQTTPEQVLAIFDEPYWIDRDEDETIFFYEYQNGKVELQFEFSGKTKLGVIILSRDGTLSFSEQRKAYGVAKEWPPK